MGAEFCHAGSHGPLAPGHGHRRALRLCREWTGRVTMPGSDCTELRAGHPHADLVPAPSSPQSKVPVKCRIGQCPNFPLCQRANSDIETSLCITIAVSSDALAVVVVHAGMLQLHSCGGEDCMLWEAAKRTANSLPSSTGAFRCGMAGPWKLSGGMRSPFHEEARTGKLYFQIPA